MEKIVVTGSSGLIGSEVVETFCKDGYKVYGVDNNMRKDFFGPKGDTSWNRDRLIKAYKNFEHIELDIRNRQGVLKEIAKITTYQTCKSSNIYIYIYISNSQ